jgi:hypothetical protein
MTSIRSTLVLVMLIGLVQQATAQPGPVSPVRAGARKLDEIGRVIGPWGQPCRPGWAPEFGRTIWRLGDVDEDGTVDWAANIWRCDTVYAEEILLYKSRRGQLPQFGDGIRIGPTEFATKTSLVAVGDFDADRHPDLVLSYEIMGDTSLGNTDLQYHFVTVIVMWGNERGEYSIDDTTRLECEADKWMAVVSGAGGRFTGNDVDDLFIHSRAGWRNGQPIRTPELRIFRGIRGRRWGRDPGAPRTAQWTAWSLPNFTLRGAIEPYQRMRVLDHDCDGALDFVFHRDETTPPRLSILYGRPGGFPDTLANETVYYGAVSGQRSMLADVTGDHAPELLVGGGYDRDIKIYAGRPGQRLLEQYGTGRDGPIAGRGWWSRPWATMWTPDHIDSTWGAAGFGKLLELGDVDLDGRADIWLESDMYLGYLTGPNLDSLADTWLEVPGSEIRCIVPMGDIDHSGRQAIAVSYDVVPHEGRDPFPGGVMFVYGSTSLRKPLFPPRLPPHIEGEHCEGVASVDDERRDEAPIARAQVIATVDRTQGVIRLEWQGMVSSEPVRCSVHSILGELLYRTTTAPGVTATTIAQSSLVPGLVLVSIESPSSPAAVTVVGN